MDARRQLLDAGLSLSLAGLTFKLRLLLHAWCAQPLFDEWQPAIAHGRSMVQEIEAGARINLTGEPEVLRHRREFVVKAARHFLYGDGMDLIILIPAVACWCIGQGLRAKCPDQCLSSLGSSAAQYFELRFTHFPPMTFAATAIIPLGVQFGFRKCGAGVWIGWTCWCCCSPSAQDFGGLSTVLADGKWLRLFTSPAETLQADVNNGIFQLLLGLRR